MTLNNPETVGESWGSRDSNLLRSQLEPWNTTGLRRRLVQDFGGDLLDLDVEREGVMNELLRKYEREGERRVLKFSGARVSRSVCDELLGLLREWKEGFKNGNDERVAVDAENYMILTKVENVSSRNKSSAVKKIRKYQLLWNAAEKAINYHDPDFGFTAVAVTHNFKGSPHIDRQNSGAFYGLSLGEFTGGSIHVELSPRIVGEVETRERWGKVDGRWPHWVGGFEGERFSLIFYRTEGRGEECGGSVYGMPVGEVEL
ncbi:hypothetical protein TrLO_g12128 [Triparma laevis f. longispina]|uniref:Uncharacterized protein n=1 Tax=Triparma laevis f. longispina TaxID=1714387 RepID=A0A9W7E350_9STRA|nr:hypothetical protein TrLO_g12128 [Triparma laevis f. longispina]